MFIDVLSITGYVLCLTLYTFNLVNHYTYVSFILTTNDVQA